MIRVAVIYLLLLNGFSAVAVGYISTLTDVENIPGIMTSTLFHFPLNDLFIWSSFLFVLVGLVSIVLSVIALSRGIFYPILLSLLGISLLIWVFTQIVFLGFIHPFILVLGILSLFLIPAGFFFKKFK